MARIRLIRLLLAMSWLVTGCGRTEPHQVDNSAHEKIDRIVRDLRDDSIGAVEVLHIHSSTMFRTRITPSSLERFWDHKLTIRSLSSSKADKLARLLSAIPPLKSEAAADIRSGVIFYSREGQERVVALYFDRSGRHGAIDDIPVSFADSIGAICKVLSEDLE